MRSRGTVPVRVNPIDEDGPFSDMQIKTVLKEISFLRVQVDNVTFHESNQLIDRTIAKRQLMGFFLEYTFPCLESVSKSLRTTVRLPSKIYNNSIIEFRHKVDFFNIHRRKPERIVLLTMHEDIIAFWQKSKVLFHLLIQMESAGKIVHPAHQTMAEIEMDYSRFPEGPIQKRLVIQTRPFGKCSVSLKELLVSPFMVCRDFAFVGPEFEGTALIKIDLGSHVKHFMEKLDSLRNHTALNSTFVVPQRFDGPTKTRSRSSSRCRAHNGNRDENRSPSPTQRRSSSRSSHEVFRPIIIAPETRNTTRLNFPRPTMNGDRDRARSATSSLESESVFIRDDFKSTRHQAPFRPLSNDGFVESAQQKATNVVRNASSRASSISEEISFSSKCSMQLTVHGATGLPPVRDEFGRIVSPNAFVSVRGREGELRSQVCEATRQPRWDWTALFAMSSERRNLVIKIMHRGQHEDKPLGFVTISLPVEDSVQTMFEVTDVSQMNSYTIEVPMISMSIENVRHPASPRQNHRHVMYPSSSRSVGSSTHPSLPESPEILESSEEIKRRMLKSVAELDNKLRDIRL